MMTLNHKVRGGVVCDKQRGFSGSRCARMRRMRKCDAQDAQIKIDCLFYCFFQSSSSSLLLLVIILYSLTLFPYSTVCHNMFFNNLSLIDFSCNVPSGSYHCVLRYLTFQIFGCLVAINKCSHEFNAKDPTISVDLLGNIIKHNGAWK